MEHLLQRLYSVDAPGTGKWRTKLPKSQEVENGGPEYEGHNTVAWHRHRQWRRQSINSFCV